MFWNNIQVLFTRCFNIWANVTLPHFFITTQINTFVLDICISYVTLLCVIEMMLWYWHSRQQINAYIWSNNVLFDFFSAKKAIFSNSKKKCAG